MEYNNEKEREIDLRSMVLYLWDKAIIIILVGIICAGVLATYNYKNQKAVSSDSLKKSTINSIIEQNKVAYYNESNEIKPFTYAAVPNNAFNSIAKIYVDFNFETIENNTNMDFATMIEKVQNDAIQLIVSEESLQEAIDELSLFSYSDMGDITPEDLRWMISGYSDGTGVIQLTVTDVDPDRAKQIADKVLAIFLEKSESYSFIDEVKIVDEPSLPKGSSQLDSVIINKKTVLKYALVGLLGGMVIVAVILVILFVVIDTVRVADDLERIDAKCYGIVTIRNSVEDYKRIASSLLLSKDLKTILFIPLDKYSEETLVVQNVIKELELSNKKVILVDDKDVSHIDDIIQKNKDRVDYLFIKTRNIADYGEAMVAATYSDISIGIATYEKTKVRVVSFALKEMKKIDESFKGIIIDSAKHIR